MEQKAELGTKRICPSCAARFYDLMKRPIVCPKCQTSFDPEVLLRPRRQRPEAREAPPAKVVEKEVLVEEEEEETEEDEVFDDDEDTIEEDDDTLVVEEEDEEGVEPESGTKAKAPGRRRKRALIAEDDDLPLPEGDEDESLDVDAEEDDLLVEEADDDVDLDDDALVEIDPDLEDDGKEAG